MSVEREFAESETFRKGLQIRKEVLGAEHVEKSLGRASEFSADVQHLVTEYCWGAVWGRDGISRAQRSMLNLAMIAVLNRKHELGSHVRGALNNGVTRDEIKEVFLQVAVYAGMPAALDAFRVAEEVFVAVDAAAGE